MSHSQEILTICAGQCGVQAGMRIWDLLCAEHGITFDGHLNPAAENDKQIDYPSVSFEENLSDQWIPRAVFIDCDESVLDALENGVFKNIISPKLVVHARETADGCYARGKNLVSQLNKEEIYDKLRTRFEECHNCIALFNISSSCGGLASGILPSIQEKTGGYKYESISLNVFPHAFTAAPVEIYNNAFYMNAVSDYSDITLLFDNAALYRIAEDYIPAVQSKKRDIEITYFKINELIAYVYSGMTCGNRSNASFSVKFLTSNLVPYRGISFLSSYATPNFPMRRELSNSVLTNHVFEKNSSNCSVDLEKGSYLTTCLVYHGPNMCLRNITQSLKKIHDTNEFISWIPNPFKTGIDFRTPVTMSNNFFEERQITKIFNHTSVAHIFESLDKNFKILDKMRCFRHWFIINGLDPSEFEEASYSISLIGKAYSALHSAAKELPPKDEDVG